VLSLGHQETFQRCVEHYRGDACIKFFTCYDQWLAMAFAQLTARASLSDLEASLSARRALLYQMGFRGRVVRSTLSNANERRDWRIYADWAQTLIKPARKIYAEEPVAIELDQTVYALDATVIDLCLSLFPWAHFHSAKAAIKLHTLLDLSGSIPTFVTLTEGAVHEVNILDELPFEAGAIYVMDRGYLDFARSGRFTQAGVIFVIRGKTNLKFYLVESRQVDPSIGLRCDQTIQLRGFYSKQDYPQSLRRVRYYDAEHSRSLVFLTNHFGLSALQVCEVYRARWQIELFFKWIKGHLRICSFVGTTENALRIQIWTALSADLLVAILKKILKLKRSLHEILQVISVTPFEKVPIRELFARFERDSLTPEITFDDSKSLF
jgi:hypothetical protein